MTQASIVAVVLLCVAGVFGAAVLVNSDDVSSSSEFSTGFYEYDQSHSSYAEGSHPSSSSPSGKKSGCGGKKKSPKPPQPVVEKKPKPQPKNQAELELDPKYKGDS